ncbi:MAG: NUDIX hydrolase [Candidatus Latescibacteria bacterium]|jgi:ADP-ribose pyrophosphatase|nr:NUDIX hydrolase [Candidatus Latescibacterota bacterium]
MKVEIKRVSSPYEYALPNGRTLFRVDEAVLSHERFDGTMSPDLTRVNFERGDGVGVLLYASDSNEVVLVEQFRYPVYASLPEGAPGPRGWLVEIVAGIKDAEGHVVAQRELLEETGYELSDPLERLTTVYASPGGSSERIELYLARVKQALGIRDRAGLPSESEDIRPVVIPLPVALEMAQDGRIQDAKTLIALLMLRDRLKR